MNQPLRICFVCTGNICRSPMAQVVMERLIEAEGLADKVVVDSAGTGSWHVGENMDPRASAALKSKGYRCTGHRAQRIDRGWLGSRDMLVALDRSHLAALGAMAGPEDFPKIRLLLEGEGESADVPDPYYGGQEDFETALELIEGGCSKLIEQVRGRLDLADESDA